jgi:general secretion pathway protein G
MSFAARATSRRSRISTGFTLVEILIVVVILGILATIVIPQFTSATHDTRENMLKDCLRFLRTQVQVFKCQHRDVPPGYPGGDNSLAGTETDFVDQMTTFSSEACATSISGSPTFRFGPYLSSMPRNPLNDSASVLVMPNGVPLRAPAADAYGWIYRPDTQEIIANLIGNDSNGKPYAQY